MGPVAWMDVKQAEEDRERVSTGAPALPERRTPWSPWRGLALIGFMGAGKTTAGRALAAELSLPWYDSDEQVEARLGHPIAAEFEEAGEARFREVEEQVVLELLTGCPDQSIVSLGGGSVLSRAVRDALERYLVVLLDVDPESAWTRARSQSDARPLAQEKESFDELHRQRAAIYEQLADAILPAVSPEVCVEAMQGLAALSRAPDGTKMLWATAPSGSYPVLIGEGLVTAGGEGGCAAERAWPVADAGCQRFCVSDENVAAIYGSRFALVQQLITFPAGESHKTLETVERVSSALARAGMTRSDELIALGGGVVGDLAGFCAATYQRGVSCVQVPSTLVAQVDSAYGGKTGVDLPEGKNYIGAYHQPAAVIVDPSVLETLPERELAAGWVEVAKTALIAGGRLWEKVRSEEPVDVEMILSCARAKLEVVAADERDAGARQALNLGHTIGHAIETVTGYERYLHGEAVGLGLLAALRLSGAAELRQWLLAALERRGLPTDIGQLSAAQIVAATERDKKRMRGASVPFVLVRAPGQVEAGHHLERGEVLAAVEELRR